MKKLLSSTAAISLMVGSAAVADPTAMVGLALNFGGGQAPSYGVTAKVLSSNEPEAVVGAVGVSYFFDRGGYFGADAGLAYTFDNGAVALTYDFLNNRPQVSAGWADIC